MSTQHTDTADPEESRSDPDRPPRARRVLAGVARRRPSGTAAAAAVGLLLADAVRTAGRDRRRTGAAALAGAAFLAVGLRRRRGAGGTGVGDDRVETESAEARANLERSDVLHQSETNPRGTSGEPDIDADNAEGDVEFTTEARDEPGLKPHLDGEDPADPRYLAEGDPGADDVEVDLSDASLADEASEATGPDDDQAYPAAEGTDPEPTSAKAPERTGEGAVANPDSDDETE